MKVIADVSLPKISECFQGSFELSLFDDKNELKEKLPNQDILICRSTLKIDKQLLKNSSVKIVATATSGTDHIDQEYLKQNNIKLFTAKGANASAVADYVMSSLAVLENNKLIQSNKAAVIGLGCVGVKVSQRLHALGFSVAEYDPLKSLCDPSFRSCELSDIFDCSLLCIHANLHSNPLHPSMNLFNAKVLNCLAEKTVLINAARGGIVNEKELLENKKKLIYVTDVFEDEPEINKEVISYATIGTPHIAGHSLEAKEESVEMISRQIHQYLGVNLEEKTHKKIRLPETLSDISYMKWPEIMLSLYDPRAESTCLKKSANIKDAFLNLRKSHNFRHGFNSYSFPKLTKDKAIILGLT